MKKERSVLLLRLQAAQSLNNEAEYTQSIEDYRTAHPEDACVDLLSIDFHVVKKQYPEALACIDRLDHAVLGDPYLQILRANAHAEQNDLVAARADLEKAIAAEPDLLDAYWSLVSVSLKDKNFNETLRTLRLIRDRFPDPDEQPGRGAALPGFRGVASLPGMAQGFAGREGRGQGADRSQADGNRGQADALR